MLLLKIEQLVNEISNVLSNIENTTLMGTQENQTPLNLKKQLENLARYQKIIENISDNNDGLIVQFGSVVDENQLMFNQTKKLLNDSGYEVNHNTQTGFNLQVLIDADNKKKRETHLVQLTDDQIQSIARGSFFALEHVIVDDQIIQQVIKKSYEQNLKDMSAGILWGWGADVYKKFQAQHKQRLESIKCTLEAKKAYQQGTEHEASRAIRLSLAYNPINMSEKLAFDIVDEILKGSLVRAIMKLEEKSTHRLELTQEMQRLIEYAIDVAGYQLHGHRFPNHSTQILEDFNVNLPSFRAALANYISGKPIAFEDPTASTVEREPSDSSAKCRFNA